VASNDLRSAFSWDRNRRSPPWDGAVDSFWAALSRWFLAWGHWLSSTPAQEISVKVSAAKAA